MQANYISPLNNKPFIIKHLVTLYRRHISSKGLTALDEPICSYNSFVFIENGNAVVTVGDKGFSVKSKSIVFIPPSHYYQVKSSNGLSVSYIYASFVTDSAFFKNIPSQPIACDNFNCSLLSSAIESAELAVQSLENNTSEQVHGKGINKANINLQIAYNYIELFLLMLLDSIAVEPYKESHKLTRHANITASVEEYLKAHIRENISLHETAQYFGYSVSNIQKIFKAVTGQSIIVYFNKLKLEEAKRLIIENNMSFSQISSYLNFSNPNYFSRIFKTMVGMTPTEYATLYQKNDNNSYKSSSKKTRNKNK